MTIQQTLTNIIDALKTNHLEHEAIREEMVTKADLAAVRAEMATKAELAALRAEVATKAELAEVAREVRRLGVDFEAFRHNTKITLDMLSELMTRRPVGPGRPQAGRRGEG